MAPPISQASSASFSPVASTSAPYATPSASKQASRSQQSSTIPSSASLSASQAHVSSAAAPASSTSASSASQSQSVSTSAAALSSSAGAPSFVSESFVDHTIAQTGLSTPPRAKPVTLPTHSIIVSQAGQLSPLTRQRRAAATQDPQRASSSRGTQHLDPYLQTLLEANVAAAFRPPSPSSAPALTLSYRSRPEATQFPSFAALLESLPKPSTRRSRTSESTPAPSSISTHPSSPLTSEHPDLAASSLTEATSIAAESTSESASTATSTPQLSAPKLNAWGAPKSWADTLGRNGLNAKGPIGISVNVGQELASAASDFGSPSVSRSPKAAVNGKKAGRKSGAAQSKPAVMSLERLLADAHTRFDAPVTHPRGLVNKGNFCFANAILQTLVYCAPFYNLFSLIGREVPADFGNATPLMEAVIHFLREFLPTDATNSIHSPQLGQDASLAAASEPFLPEFVYDAMRLNKRFDQMRRGHQEDAEEFLGFFLDTLHEELISAQRRSAIKLAQSAGGPNGILAKMSEEEKKLNGVSDDDLKRLGVRVGKDAASADAVGLGLDAALDEDEIIEREVMRPVSPSEEGWMEVGQKGKTAYTRTTSTSESPITRIFGGKLRSVLKTPGAKDSVTLEPYQPLQLDIQPPHVQSIEDALLHLTEPETIPGVWSPSRAAEVDATKQVFVESLPPVLVLHLKRFIYDEIGGVQKSQKPLSYGTTLEIAPEVLSPAMRSQPQPRYRLFGIVYHHGRYASGGHYTVDVLRQDGHSWLHIDDTMFHTVPTEHVVRNAASPSRDYGHDGLAYLLFYRRELPGEAEAATKQAASAVSNVAKASAPASVNGSHPVPVAAAIAAKSAPAAPAAAPPAKAKQHKAVSGAKTPNGSANSAASSPRVAHASPKPAAAAANAAKTGKKAVPGWDR
ncbi:related to Ubiquitin carboxyl-terminal hydrolase 10 [Ustilago trichophora]|uniref:Ubiquitin carboxyl-terminal hydrolase n=1 Tax=Ustilago trichophora TaxID=86804 RepID=A0A5C3EEM0_9BASI|nr:related to Ubiquitin carboxyl-terminal hydrolase 10 [Ustilago trichophora]